MKLTDKERTSYWRLNYDILKKRRVNKYEFIFMLDAWHYDFYSYWCLCRGCIKYGKRSDRYDFWFEKIKEILDHYRYARVMKRNKRNLLHRHLIRIFDYENSRILRATVKGELMGEGFEETEASELVNEFTKNIRALIKILSNDKLPYDKYINDNLTNEENGNNID